MEGVWDDEYEEDDFLDMYGEALEVPEPGQKKTKEVKPDEVEKLKRKPVLNPRPKLDVERLLNDKDGLPQLLNKAHSLTFTPGKEVEDMRRAISTIEHWAHRLFPKYTSDDFFEKCETLGKKRPVKTHLRKVRIGLIPM